MKKNEFFRYPALVLSVFVGLCAAMASGQEATPDVGQMHQFTLKVTATESGSPLNFTINGQLRWVARSLDQWEYELEFNQVTFAADSTATDEPIEVLPKMIPFTARVAVSSTKTVPVGMDIIEGKMDMATDDFSLGQQYQWTTLVSDMLLLTPVKKPVTMNPVGTPGKQTVLNTEYADQLKIPDLGVVKGDSFRSRNTPTEFAIYPNLGKQLGQTSDLVSLEFGGLTFSYYYRLLDSSEGISSRAVNLRASLSEATDEMGYAEWLKMLEQPRQLKSYIMYDLTLGEN